MNYIEIESDGKRFRLPASHHHFLKLQIDPADWHRFNQFADDDPTYRIIGHDDPADDWMTVRIACGSERVAEQLEDAW